MIEYDDHDTILIDKVYIHIDDDYRTFYGINGICIYEEFIHYVGSAYAQSFNSSNSTQKCGANSIYSDAIGINAQQSEYVPSKQKIYFLCNNRYRTMNHEFTVTHSTILI